MTTKHTPAPWSLDLGIRNAAILDTKGNEIASVEVGIHDEETELELQANAKLIAAAPDLLAALEVMLEDFDGWSDEFIPSIEKARAAIAKATT